MRRLAEWRECSAVRMAPASEDSRVAALEFEGPAPKGLNA